MEQGRALDTARKKAISLFQPEIKTKKVRVKEDERGLVISLASDAFFKTASADLDIENTRSMLIKVADLLSEPELSDRKFRIEGHTDGAPTDPSGLWPSNWELSAARSVNVLHYLVNYGVTEDQFQVAGFADTVPLADRGYAGGAGIQPARRHHYPGRRSSLSGPTASPDSFRCPPVRIRKRNLNSSPKFADIEMGVTEWFPLSEGFA